MTEALLWGLLGGGSLLVGQLLASPLGRSSRTVGLMMAFGSGTLISAIGYELIPESNLQLGWEVGAAFLLGALVYYAGARLVDRGGGSGTALFLGALLDGIPESFILGLGLALGGSISVAFLAAVLLSNIPEGLAGTVDLRRAGVSERRVTLMWTSLTVVCGLASLAGFLVADQVARAGELASAFAGGAVLTMLADSMVPESYERAGRVAGLLTVLGFLTAGVLSALQ
ncbi:MULTISPECIES: ZIP family metal transporter [unclassified Nocardioides]|uniref:ZIP family metal transporter n=1 Tax=unclassified Nocardioides TaxID=2615069 RepID=UPI00360AE605